MEPKEEGVYMHITNETNNDYFTESKGGDHPITPPAPLQIHLCELKERGGGGGGGGGGG